MLQEILALSIVAGALVYFIHALYRTFIPKKGKEKGHSCAGCTSGGCGVVPRKG